jgi:antagonist of KipI
MSIEVIKPGMLTTVQDLGRYGYQKYGVIASGAMDLFALRATNILVGNHEKEAVLEMTVLGASILFHTDALIAVGGGNLTPSINGHSIPLWRPVYIKKGSQVRFGGSQNGCRAYLAVAGGFDIPEEMDSRSTYLGAGIGGWKGRALKEGDLIPFRPLSSIAERIMSMLSSEFPTDLFTAAQWQISHDVLPRYGRHPTIRVMEGNQFASFDSHSKEAFFNETFKISPQSNRMGYRIEGENLRLSEPLDMISEAVAFGTVQVPPDGNPIVLMADHQTTGGYPKIAQIISVDLPVMAQLNPGEKLHFRKVTLQEAEELFIERETDLSLLKQGVEMK